MERVPHSPFGPVPMVTRGSGVFFCDAGQIFLDTPCGQRDDNISYTPPHGGIPFGPRSHWQRRESGGFVSGAGGFFGTAPCHLDDRNAIDQLPCIRRESRRWVFLFFICILAARR